MERNIEIKARIESLETLRSRVTAIASAGPIEMDQDDIFFSCEAGRLKLRAFSEGGGELIFYRRANQREPKESFYIRSLTSTPDALRESLTLACGQVGRVRKHRTLYVAGRTCIHLDKVEGIGNFLEIEVVLAKGESPEGALCEADALIKALELKASQLVSEAYVDLVAQQQAKPPPGGNARLQTILCAHHQS